jgi:elongation factor 1 alpha-like protein
MDEYEGYSEEEDELSPEDRALLTQGTADVQAALGVEASKVTVAQIEEALWHYYYDVDKSVAYLTSKFINPRPKATKPAARQPNGKAPTCAIDPAEADLPLALDAPGYWARKHLDLTNAAPHTSSTSYIPLRTSELLPAPAAIAVERRTSYISHLFRDMPWGNIPKHREATFVPPPMPRGGLLGGSGTAPKMSKLQALAAARKKKAEEKTANKNKPTVADSPAAKTDVPLAGLLNKRLKISEPTPQGRTTPILASAVPESTQPGSPQRRDVAADIPQDEPIAKSEPSTFAEVLCGLPSDSRKTRTRGQRPLATDELFDVFGLPSGTSEQAPPEDVALATTAQSPAFAQPLGGGIRSRVSNARFRTDETPVDPSLFRKRYGPDNKGKPPKEPFDYTWWFDIRKRKRDDSDGYEEVVVLYPNLPQPARDNFAQPSPDDIVLAAQAKAKGKGSLLKKSMG